MADIQKLSWRYLKTYDMHTQDNDYNTFTKFVQWPAVMSELSGLKVTMATKA